MTETLNIEAIKSDLYEFADRETHPPRAKMARDGAMAISALEFQCDALIAHGLLTKQEKREIEAPLRRILELIAKAGLSNLSSGVQLGATSWHVKMSDAIEWAQSALTEASTLPREK